MGVKQKYELRVSFKFPFTRCTRQLSMIKLILRPSSSNLTLISALQKVLNSSNVLFDYDIYMEAS